MAKKIYNFCDCQRKGVVYCLKCSCDEEYIGHTGRRTITRIQEHKRSLKHPSKKSYKNMPLAMHRKKCHDGRLTNFTISILAREINNKKRLILEANQIKYRNPTINGKEEQEQILKLLMPSKKIKKKMQPLKKIWNKKKKRKIS